MPLILSINFIALAPRNQYNKNATPERVFNIDSVWSQYEERRNKLTNQWPMSKNAFHIAFVGLYQATRSWHTMVINKSKKQVLFTCLYVAPDIIAHNSLINYNRSALHLHTLLRTMVMICDTLNPLSQSFQTCCHRYMWSLWPHPPG